GDLDGGIEALLLNRFEQVAQRLGLLRPLQRRVVGLAREINHRQAEALAEDSGRFDSVHLSFEPDVHEHQIRLRRGRLSQRFFSRESQRGSLVSEVFQPFLNVFGEEAFVLHHQDASLVHTPRCLASVCGETRPNRHAHFFWLSAERWIGIRTPTVVPLPCRPMMLTSPSSTVARSLMPRSPSERVPDSSRPVMPRPLSCTSRISLSLSSLK